MINGIEVGVIEILLFLFASYKIQNNWPKLKSIPIICYYWFMMTILTFVWEASYIIEYKHVVNMSRALITDKQHVWTNNYTISAIIPWNLAPIFYSEYGAYADREYMSVTDQWSKIVEGSHLLFCGLFALMAVVAKTRGNNNLYLVAANISMGTQLMNSILYMCSYYLLSDTPDSVNYANSSFPMGSWMSHRPFMWVNIFWTIMPSYYIVKALIWAFNRDRKVINRIKNLHYKTDLKFK